MTINEVSAGYGVPLEVLKEYESWGLGAAKKTTGEWEYDDRDIELLGIVMTLHDIGFDDHAVEAYMQLYLKGKSAEKQRLMMLDQKRAELLNEVHLKEAKISCLDYLRYEIQPIRGKTKAGKR